MKIKLSVRETLKYQREVVVEVPDDISEKTLYAILNNADRESFDAEDFADKLDSHPGFVVVERPDRDMSSPWDTEVESDYLD